MSLNVMDEYSKITVRQLNDYMRVILGDKYRKYICDEFSEVYINIRYNGLISPRKGLTVRNKLFQELKKREIELANRYPEQKRLIEYTYLFYDDCAFFDTVQNQSDIKEKVEEILDIRREFLGEDKVDKSDEVKFRLNLLMMVQMNNEEKQKFLDKFDTKEFSLRFRNYRDNLQTVKISQNVKFSYIYSTKAIDEAFASDITFEDKLLVEYYMLCARIIKEIEKSDYRKEYLPEFSSDLLEKEAKLKRLLNIIDNSTMKERITLIVSRDDFNTYREKIYDLISAGFNFGIKLDDDFNGNEAEVQTFSILKYIICKKKLPQLHKLNNVLVI